MSGRTLCGIVIGTLVLWSIALPQEGTLPRRQPVRGVAATHTPKPQALPADSNRKIVDFRSDVMRPVKIGDSSYMNLLGNVILYHNGAIITCDSAIRYNDKRMECFGRVVINKDSLYIYGDRAFYNGEENLARVFAPIIKMTDGSATLYTYRFSFNTLDNIGIFSGGGVMSQKESQLESRRGYYYADRREMIAVEEVEMRNPDYRIRSDSIGYNTKTEIATFFRKSFIWNTKDEILSADRGFYNQPDSIYHFTSNAYILTATREIWADTMDYRGTQGDAVMRHDVQLRDEDQNVIGFGDYGEYWGTSEDAMLTLNPSLINFDAESDTLYMRSDSIFLFSVPYGTGRPAASDTQKNLDEEELIVPAQPALPKERMPDSLRMPEAEPVHVVTDSLRTDSLRREEISIPDDSVASAQPVAPPVKAAPPTKEEQKRIKAEKQAQEKKEREMRRAEKNAAAAKKWAEKEAAKRAKDAARPTKKEDVAVESDNIAGDSVSDTLPGLNRMIAWAEQAVGELAKAASTVTGEDSLRLAETAAAALAELQTMTTDTLAKTVFAWAGEAAAVVREGGTFDLGGLRRILSGETAENNLSDMSIRDAGITDSLSVVQADSTKTDSLERIVRAYRNVRIFRNDFQAVCDSLVGFSIDSTFHLYIDPVLWNNDNQITSEYMDIFTRNQQIERALFIGDPIMISEVDTAHYNQIKGKVMESFFRNNEIYRTDVNGNGQTYYYMMDDANPDDIIGFLVAECADITFMINERRIETITWRGSPVYSIYPMNKIPPEQSERLPGFQWLPERRPTIDSVFYGRTIRLSERKFYESLTPPIFSITEAIMADKARMIRDGIWIERNDQIGPDVRDFIRSLGY